MALLRRGFGKLYGIVPPWAQPIARDPFDYKLRTIEEVREEFRTRPPKMVAQVTLVDYTDAPNHPMSAVVKVELNMEDWNLTRLQRERLIFLLGPRYVNSPYFRVIVKHFSNKEQNIEKAFDIINELYLETKRAP